MTEEMKMKDVLAVKRLVARYVNTAIPDIMDVLHKYEVSPDEGEHLLAFLAGLSRGHRQITVMDLTAPLAIGWQFAASIDTQDTLDS